MQYPENRYTFATQKRKKNRTPLILYILAIIVGGGIMLFFFLRQNGTDTVIVRKDINPREKMISLWEEQQYTDLIKFSSELLEKNPMDPYALVFCGFANFYEGVGKYSLEDKIQYIDRAVICLRKADILENKPFAGGIKYVLGKSYYHKGRFYVDTSISYLEQSLALGYSGEDTYEYLGLAYSELERYEKSIDYFNKAVEIHPSDLLFLTLAQTYFETGQIDLAEEYLIRTVNRTKDNNLEEKSRFLLGKIYLERNEFLKAEDQYRKILENNDNSADAHYYLGVIYDTMGDRVKARAEWRLSLRIDPSHYGARLKLYN